MAKPMTDVEEVTGSGTYIENALTPAAIKIELLDPFEIRSHPLIQIEILLPPLARIGDSVAIMNCLKLHEINAADDFLDIKAKKKTSGQNHAAAVPFDAGQETRIGKFSELV